MATKEYDNARIKQQSAKGNLWQKKNPAACRERMRKIRAEHGRNDGIFAQMIDDQRDPLNIKSNNIIIASDFHIPFHNLSLTEKIFEIAEEYSVTDFACPGDFWDCDTFSSFNPINPIRVSFEEEKKHVRDVLDLITKGFKNVNFCRGNHERRWINITNAKTTVKDLFAMTGITRGYKVTSDDHMFLDQNGEKWLLCHPKNYRITPLSVVRDLAAKFNCHVWGGHGHQFGQGWDRSGNFRVVDGGGIFDVHSLEYHRETTCHPEQKNGFYLLQDNIAIPFEPDHNGNVKLSGDDL